MITGSCHCGAVHWEVDGDPGPVTACNCTTCRRYGALWVYDFHNERIRVSGETTAYLRVKAQPALGYHFCPKCGCLAYWLARMPEKNGKLRLAVNVRLADDPEAVAALPIEHFDGLTSFEDLGQDGRCVRDMWF